MYAGGADNIRGRHGGETREMNNECATWKGTMSGIAAVDRRTMFTTVL